MMKLLRVWLALIFGVLAVPDARAWSANGHQTVGAIADALLAGSRASREVQAVLGTVGDHALTLQDVSVWADCARAIQPGQDFAYNPGKFRESACALFEDDAGKAAMADFVRRNNTNCQYAAKDFECHKAFHFTDVDIAHDDYETTFAGTNDHDVVHAIQAAVARLQDQPVAPPFQFGDQREALKVLVHYVGDVHQPLHVGAVYLAADGTAQHPQANPPDPATDTIGGNALHGTGGNLHHQWDTTRFAFTDPATLARFVTEAQGVALTAGPPSDWATVWASDTVLQAQRAFAGVAFGARDASGWPLRFDDRRAYTQQMVSVQQAQVVQAGAHLAALLRAIWPD